MSRLGQEWVRTSVHQLDQKSIQKHTVGSSVISTFTVLPQRSHRTLSGHPTRPSILSFDRQLARSVRRLRPVGVWIPTFCITTQKDSTDNTIFLHSWLDVRSCFYRTPFRQPLIFQGSHSWLFRPLCRSQVFCRAGVTERILTFSSMQGDEPYQVLCLLKKPKGPFTFILYIKTWTQR